METIPLFISTSLPMPRLVLVFLIALATLAVSPSLSAEIYQWTDAQGRAHFSDEAPKKSKAKKIQLETNTYKHVAVPPQAKATARPQRVVMYATKWCGYCKKARNYFRKNNIRYTEYDIEKSARAKQRYNKLGGKGVPLILVGKKRMTGFSAQRFATMFGGFESTAK